MLKIASNLELPNEAITQTFAILARRGAGKTYTASVMAEEMLEQGYCIVWLDPLGVAWGLRSKYKILILGGERGDLPLEPTAGKVVAEFLVAEHVPAILDVSLFGENEMRRFVADFAATFYRLNRDPVHWFVDEADEFAPQSGMNGGHAAKCLSAMQNIVRRGRARGIGVTMITQRSAVLNKSVLTQTECLIAMQTTGPHDLKAIDEWIKYNGTPGEREEIMRSLTKLEQGEAFVYSPGWLKILKKVKIRKRRTHDSSATPKPGETRRQPKRLADINLGFLQGKMTKTIEAAKSNDPKELKKKIVDLKKQLSNSSSQKPTTDRAVRQAEAARDRYWQGEVSTLKKNQNLMVKRLQQIEKLSKTNGDASVSIAEPIQRQILIDSPVRNPAQTKTGEVGKFSLKQAHIRILISLYWLKNEDRTPAKVAFFSRYTVNGHFANTLGKLRSHGLVEGWSITEFGESCLPSDVEPKPTGMELREWLRPKLNSIGNKILDVLIDAGGERMASDELAAASGYTVNGHFANTLGRLRTLQMAEGLAKDGGVRANPVFFE